jgi:hypothetical protein
MKLRIEIDKSCGRNVHIVLRGIAGDSTGVNDAEIYARYIEVYKAFGDGQYPRNDAVRSGERPLAASAI